MAKNKTSRGVRAKRLRRASNRSTLSGRDRTRRRRHAATARRRRRRSWRAAQGAGNHGPLAEQGSAGRFCWPRLAHGCGSHKLAQGGQLRRNGAENCAARVYVHINEVYFAVKTHEQLPSRQFNCQLTLGRTGVCLGYVLWKPAQTTHSPPAFDVVYSVDLGRIRGDCNGMVCHIAQHTAGNANQMGTGGQPRKTANLLKLALGSWQAQCRWTCVAA
eukprot:scaffold13637_cov112-Isochrysis_galbana.AAC.4